MEDAFEVKEIVWAKVKGYPWWPAEISKLPNSDNNTFKVIFIAQQTHAFLHPKDVKKYSENYEECSKKKMKGLSLAIQAADQLNQKRIDMQIPEESPVKKSKTKNRTKIIKKQVRKCKKQQLSYSEIKQPEQKAQSSPEIEIPSIQRSELEDKCESPSSQSNIQEQRFCVESEEKIDKSKIDLIQGNLLKIVQKLRNNSYGFKQNDFNHLQSLSPDELLLGRITKILSYILTLLKCSSREYQWIKEKKESLKKKIIQHLYDTSYYDQYIKLIEKNKKNRSQYESKIVLNLKNMYKMKKELAMTFASRLMTQIHNGTISRDKELLQDIKQKKVEIIGVNNKAAIDRCLETVLPKYT